MKKPLRGRKRRSMREQHRERQMPKFRKKPVVIEAECVDDDFRRKYFGRCHWTGIRFVDDHVIIHTLEGDMRAERGDWIITGIKGERYPCKPDIFAATYEPAEETPVVVERGVVVKNGYCTDCGGINEHYDHCLTKKGA
jgi:hypothetical protein